MAQCRRCKVNISIQITVEITCDSIGLLDEDVVAIIGNGNDLETEVSNRFLANNPTPLVQLHTRAMVIVICDLIYFLL